MRVSENWRLKSERYTLKCEQPSDNEMLSFPPRPVTPRSVKPYTFNNEEQYAWALEEPAYVEIKS